MAEVYFNPDIEISISDAAVRYAEKQEREKNQKIINSLKQLINDLEEQHFQLCMEYTCEGRMADKLQKILEGEKT